MRLLPLEGYIHLDSQSLFHSPWAIEDGQHNINALFITCSMEIKHIVKMKTKSRCGPLIHFDCTELSFSPSSLPLVI